VIVLRTARDTTAFSGVKGIFDLLELASISFFFFWIFCCTCTMINGCAVCMYSEMNTQRGGGLDMVSRAPSR